MKFLILNRAFNDIDHITPIAYKLLQNNHKVHILIVNEYLNYENDYRLKFLKKKGAIVESAIKYSNYKYIKFVFDLLKKIYFSHYNYLKNKISLNNDMYVNYQIQKNHPYNYFDYVVSNSEMYKNKIIKDGVKKEKIKVLASARFNKEWIEINNNIIPSQHIKKDITRKIITFMPQHAQYNVDIEMQKDLIIALDKIDKYQIFFKPHTRNQNEKSFRDLDRLKNVRIVPNVLSSNLIDISDAIIVYGSSIVLEALYKHKLVLYPKFLHKNDTILDKFKCCELFYSLEEMIDYLNNVNLDKHYSVSEENKCIKEASNSYESDNVLQEYVDFFVKKINV